MMDILGLNRNDCALGETEYPFTEAFGKHDVRITTHYYLELVTFSLCSVIHECGHTLFELGMDDYLQGTLLNSCTAMSIHESQSRFYENLIDRSRPFCEALLPILCEYYPDQTEGLDAETLYRCVYRAFPSLIRTEADELTYLMHIMIRYELEKRMLSGDLSAADMPAA